MKKDKCTKKIAIIGGGAAGLCAAKHMLCSTQGIKLLPVIFEQKDCVGGTWVYEDIKGEGEQIFSSIYKNLRTNIPTQVMDFPDFPYPEVTKSFMHHTEVRKYLQSYAQHFNLMDNIRFETKVVHVEPVDVQTKIGSKWMVKFEKLKNGEVEEEEFDAVVICNGHYSVPNMPTIKGFEHYKKEYIHSHHYRDPEHYKGKTALVLGFGLSGRDICLELAKTCTKVFVAHKGTQCESALPSNLYELPNIDHVNIDGSFVFENGDIINVDVFVICTGYLVQMPFISKNVGMEIVDGRFVKNLFKHLFFIDNPSLCIIGLPLRAPPFRVINQQSAYISTIFSEVNALPNNVDMKIDTEKEISERMLSGQSDKHFHMLGPPKHFEYIDMLASLSGYPKDPSISKKLYEYNNECRMTNLMNYKSMEFKIINDEHFEHVK